MFNIYTGHVFYQKGKWSKDDNGSSIVVGDDSVEHIGRYEFKGMVAVTREQLVFKLSKQIKEEKNLDYPVYIDKADLELTMTPFTGVSYDRFNNLLSLVGR